MTDSERIDDKSIKLAVLQATGGDVNKKLIEPSELTKVRRAIIDLTQTGLTPKEALANFAEKVRNAKSWRGRRLEDWSDLD